MSFWINILQTELDKNLLKPDVLSSAASLVLVLKVDFLAACAIYVIILSEIFLGGPEQIFGSISPVLINDLIVLETEDCDTFRRSKNNTKY